MDDAAHAVLSAGAIGDLGLHVGLVLDVAAMAALDDAADAQDVFDRALALLAIRARSRLELRRKLLARGSDARHVEQALLRLTALGYIDDKRFAREYAHAKLARSTREPGEGGDGGGAEQAQGEDRPGDVGGMSRRRVTAELRRKGISSEQTNAALIEAGASSDDEEAAARALGARRLRALRGVDDAVRRRRLFAYLARRGYQVETIQRVLRSLMEPATDDEGA